MHKYGAHGATDVSKFGLLGHAAGLVKAQASEVRKFPVQPFDLRFNFEGQLCDPQPSCDGSHGTDVCCPGEGEGPAMGSCPRALS